MRETINRVRQKAAQCGLTKENVAVVWIVGVMLLSLVAGISSAQTNGPWATFENGYEGFSETAGFIDRTDSESLSGSYSLAWDGEGESNNRFDVSGQYPDGQHSTVRYGFRLRDADGPDNTPRMESGQTTAFGQPMSIGTEESLQSGEWYIYEMTDIDYTTANYTLRIYTTDSGGQPEERIHDERYTFVESDGDTPINSLGNVTEFGYTVGAGSPGYYVDDVFANVQAITDSGFYGTVTGTGDDPIANATVEIEGTSISTTTNEYGEYNIMVENGTYTAVASKEGYISATESVTVRGETEQDFTLQTLNESIRIDSRSFIAHGETAEYTVVVENGTDKNEVTQEATVTSNNTTIVSVDSQATELVATQDESVNGQTYIRAEYTDAQNRTYVTTHDVTVANATVENLEILPPIYRFSATIGDDMIFWAIISIFGAIVFTRLSTAFGGICAYVLAFLMGWFSGYVPFGIMLMTVMAGAFMGLNLAANIDYGAVGNAPGMGRLR